MVTTSILIFIISLIRGMKLAQYKYYIRYLSFIFLLNRIMDWVKPEIARTQPRKISKAYNVVEQKQNWRSLSLSLCRQTDCLGSVQFTSSSQSVLNVSSAEPSCEPDILPLRWTFIFNKIQDAISLCNKSWFSEDFTALFIFCEKWNKN